MFSAVVRFWPDSARTKIPSAKTAATQKINRAALDIFILLVLFYAPALRGFMSNRSRRSTIQCPGYCADTREEGKPNL